MRRRSGKRVQPRTLQEAIRLCLDHALARHHRSVARVAELVGTTEWAVYKWVAKGSLPSEKIRPFEFACGIDYITQYIALSDHKLLVDIPRGRQATQMEINDLQVAFATCVGLLIRFYEGAAGSDATVSALVEAMAGLAWHRENIEKHSQPELDLFAEGDRP